MSEIAIKEQLAAIQNSRNSALKSKEEAIKFLSAIGFFHSGEVKKQPNSKSKPAPKK